jgi:hypothetical protein
VSRVVAARKERLWSQGGALIQRRRQAGGEEAKAGGGGQAGCYSVVHGLPCYVTNLPAFAGVHSSHLTPFSLFSDSSHSNE